jgi:hypothetical protein
MWGQTETPANGTRYTAAFWTPVPLTIASYLIHLETAGEGNTAHVGIYSTPGHYNRGASCALVAGSTVSSDMSATTGDRKVTLSAPLTLPPGRYFLAYLGVGGTPPKIRTLTAVADQWYGLDVFSTAVGALGLKSAPINGTGLSALGQSFSNGAAFGAGIGVPAVLVLA